MIVATYSIAACDLEAGQWGVAVQSKFLSVGSVVPWAEPGVGAIATQAYANPRYGPDGLALLRDGLRAEEVVERLVAADDGRDERQLGVVDGQGGSASYTGPELPRLGGRTATGPRTRRRATSSSAPETVDALAETFEATAQLPLERRLLECLAAAQAAGGDRRGQQSASLLVVERNGGYAQLSDLVVDLRVDDHPRPIEELQRIYALHDRLFGKTPRDEWLPLDGALATRCASGSRGSATTASSTCAAPLGRCREPRGARRRRRRDRSRRARGAAGGLAMKRLSLDEIEGIPVHRHARLEARPPHARRDGVRDQRVHRGECRRRGRRGAHRVAARPRGDLRGDRRVMRPSPSTARRSTPLRERWSTSTILAQRRAAVAKEPNTTVLAIGGKPGQHEISRVGVLLPGAAAHGVGQTTTPRGALLEEALTETDAAAVHYQLACVEALAGNADRALDELNVAVDAAERFRAHAATDDDLASIRDDPRFPR